MMVLTRSRFIAVAGIVGMLSGGLAIFACSQPDAMNIIGTKKAAASLNSPGKSISPPSATLSADVQTRITAAKSRTAWLGSYHNRVLREMMYNRVKWVGNDTATTKFCAGTEAIMLKLAPELVTRGVVSSLEDAKEMTRQAVRNSRRCAGPKPAMVFGSPYHLTARAALSTSFYDEDFGAAIPYLESIDDAAQATDGSPETVFLAMDTFLGTASGLTGGTFDVVAGAASVTDSSSAQWFEYGEGGGFSCLSGPGCEEPTSLFQWRKWLPRLMPPFMADVVGCASAQIAYYYGGGRDPIASMVYCLLNAASNSVGALPQ